MSALCERLLSIPQTGRLFQSSLSRNRNDGQRPLRRRGWVMRFARACLARNNDSERGSAWNSIGTLQRRPRSSNDSMVLSNNVAPNTPMESKGEESREFHERRRHARPEAKPPPSLRPSRVVFTLRSELRWLSGNDRQADQGRRAIGKRFDPGNVLPPRGRRRLAHRLPCGGTK